MFADVICIRIEYQNLAKPHSTLSGALFPAHTHLSRAGVSVRSAFFTCASGIAETIGCALCSKRIRPDGKIRQAQSYVINAIYRHRGVNAQCVP